MTTTIAFPVARSIRNASAGDRVRITFVGRSSSSPAEVREVTVTAIRGDYVYTTSGKVRPGHFEGGLVRLSGDTAATYQPTIAQPARAVLAIAVLA